MQLTFGQQLIEFVTRHWLMVGAFIILLILVFIEEVRSKASAARQISSQQLTQLINRDQATVIDLRDAQAFREGHILNALNIPLGDLERDQQKLQKYTNTSVVLVDANGTKAAQFANRLRKAGFESVNVLQGGLANWKQDKMPLSKGK